MRSGRAWLVASLAVALLIAGCGGDDSASDGNSDDSAATTEAPTDTTSGGDDSTDNVDEPSTTEGPTETQSGEDTQQASAGGAGGGMLVLGDETIAFESARCFLQEQDAAAGGGKILFVAQAFGTTADGDPITIDVSRYDEDSQYTGDDVIVDIGDPFSDDAVSLQSSSDLGTVVVDGGSLTAEDLSFVDFDDASELSGSFQINC